MNAFDEPQLQRQTLSNGLEVLVCQQPHLHSVHIALFVRVGSRFETPRTNGLSHFLEHMLFRGTAAHPSAYSLNNAIETLGGTLMGATHADFTMYEVTLPPESVADGIALFGEILNSPTFGNIEIEKKIVREEILEAHDEDGRNIDPDDVSRELIFGSHPLGYKITGDAANIDSFTDADLHAHLKAFYGAKNMIFVATGAVDAADVFALAQKNFGALASGERITLTAPTFARKHARLRVEDCVGSQTDVRISFLALPDRDPRRMVLEALARVVDDGMSARLHRRICDEKGLAYDVFAALDAYEDCGIFDLGASVDHGTTPEIVKEMLEIVAELRDELVGDEELKKLKHRHEWGIRATLDDAQGLAQFYGVATLVGLTPELKAQRDAMARVTAEDIRTLAREIFQPENLSVTAIGSLEKATEHALEKIVKTFS